MGKSSRKKKEKAKDFAKPKLKVGKKLAKAANVTETSFKSVAVHMPTQLEKAADGALTTSRGVTFKGLLQQLNHFNAKIRTGAMSDLTELCTRHSHLASVELGTLLASAGPLASDSDRRVRQEFCKLLRAMLATVTAARLEPRMNLLCAHVACAQTHLSESVCNDACSLVDVIVETVDRELLRQYGTPLLCNVVRHVSGRLKSMSVYGAGELKSRGGSGGRGGSGIATDASEQAVLRKQLDYLRSVHNFLAAIAPEQRSSGSSSGSSSMTTAGERQDVCQVRATSGQCVLYHLSADMRPNPVVPWRLPRHAMRFLSGPASGRASASQDASNGQVENLSRLLQLLEPLLAEFWAHASPADLFQRLRSGKAPAGGVEFVLLTIKSLGALLAMVSSALRSWLGDDALLVLRDAGAQLEECVRVSMQCASLFQTHLSETTRCLDLQLALCRELALLCDFLDLLPSVAADSTRQGVGRGREKAAALLSAAKNVREQHQRMAEGLVVSLQRVSLASDGNGYSPVALSQLGEIGEALADVHIASGAGGGAGAVPMACFTVHVLQLDYHLLLDVCTGVVTALVRQLAAESGDEARSELMRDACRKLIGLVDVVFTSRRHDRPHVDRVAAAFPAVPTLVRRWACELARALPDAQLTGVLVNRAVGDVVRSLAMRDGEDEELRAASACARSRATPAPLLSPA